MMLVTVFGGCKKDDNLPVVKKDGLVNPNQVLTRLYEIDIKGEKLFLEVSDTPEKTQRGLMNRQSMPENQGMIFIFNPPDHLVFWMKNTYIPLDIAFIDSGGKILNIEQMKPLDTSVRYYSQGKAKYAIEVNKGYFEKRNVKAGDSISLSL